MLKRVRRAWGNVNREGKAKLGKRNCITKEAYNKLVKEMVRQTKIPYNYEVPFPPNTPEPMHVPIQEAGALKSTIAKLVKENKELS